MLVLNSFIIKECTDRESTLSRRLPLITFFAVLKIRVIEYYLMEGYAHIAVISYFGS
ncbi:hypothetical protein LCGC14_0517850 [marine sediment metagenome]|uniref:Uncharacterized protein n=1 Tax=marine sediment metagenome TaxID=412755 RepID=A0A0F9V7N0_9ZZZZ